MDFLDTLFQSTPKEEFLNCLKNANYSALDEVCDDFIKKYFAMMMMLENINKDEDDIKKFIINNYDEIDSRMNDFYIDFMSKVYGREG